MSVQEPRQTNFCAEKRFSLSYDALNAMRRNNEFCDVLFVIGGKKIAAHKVILASHSNYFNKMFIGNFKDTKLLEFKNVEITPSSLEMLLDFLYTSQLTINDSNVQDLLTASNFLMLNDVKKECLNYIEQTINIENLMTIKIIADNNKIRELQELFLSYILKNYNNIIKSNTFLSFSFELMMQLIQSDDLCAEEEEVYESAMIWLKHDLKERLRYLPELIKFIRLNLISVDYLDSTIQEEDLIQSDNTCMRYLCHAYKVHRQIKTMGNESVLTSSITHRKFTQKSQSFNILGNEYYKDNMNSLLKNFLLIKDSPEFMSLKFEQIMELIISDDLCAEELQVYEAVISWVKYDVECRSEVFPELFAAIRLPLIKVDDLIEIVEFDELVLSNSKCTDMLLDTYRILLYNKTTEYKLNIFKFRNYNLKQVMVLYMKLGYSKLEWFDKINNAFYECSLRWPSDHTTSNLILRDGRIFSINCSDGVNSVKLYDGNLKMWKTISTPHFVHTFSNIIQFYDRIYVMSNNGVEYYDMLSETWLEVKFKISGNVDLKLAIVSDLIYGVCSTKAFYYDPKTDFGQLIGSCPIDVSQIYSICSLNNQLHVIGFKYDYKKRHQIVLKKYNPLTNLWLSVIDSHDINNIKPDVTVLEENLYLIGGTNCKYIGIYKPKIRNFELKNVYLNSSADYGTEAFVIDTKIINRNNILKYYSSNEI